MKKTKIFIFILSFIITLSLIHVKATTGYTYDHKGQAIYSTIGLTVNQNPYIFSTLGISKDDFTSPEDLFIYIAPNGEKTIYIVDSISNKLFVFDENFVLKETISSFTLPVKNFTLAELGKIKSNKNWVLARNTIFLQVGAKEALNYKEPSFIPDEIRFTSKDPNVAIIESEAGVDYVKAKSAGSTTVTVEFYSQLDLDKETPTPSESQTFNVVATVEEPGSIVDPNKTSGFSVAEINNINSFQLKLSGVVCVYRAVNDNGIEDYIYLCDKGNNQIVVVDANTYEVVKFVTAPDDVSFQNIAFAPKDIVTDGPGRMYVIADNIYEGIIQFSKEGVFNRFTGVNYVTLTAWEIFWRNISTEAQLSKQKSIINTSFTSMFTKSAGFIYTTAYATTNESGVVTNDNAMIKLINTSGSDVIRRNGYQAPKGDVTYIRSSTSSSVRGPSKLTGIAVNDYGIYTVVDSKMGKLFTYDYEGNLLYISGQPLYISSDRGTQIDTLSNPVAIAYYNDDILVLDKNNKAILVYENTDIGVLINKAVKHEYYGDADSAALVWQEVVKQNSNYEYAYIGIGKMYRKNKDYLKAMEYFKIGADRKAYSRAFKLYRDTQIKKVFPYVAGTIITIIALKLGYNFVKHKRFRKVKAEGEETYD